MSRPLYFSNLNEFRTWLNKNGGQQDELLVGFYKKGTGRPSMTWPESVDVALCFGWIDGIRKRVDDERYTIRFTPRRPKSNWSARNIERAEAMIKESKMRPAGLEAYLNRPQKDPIGDSNDKVDVKLWKAYEKLIRANEKAWDYFQSLAPSYKKTSARWVISAKRRSTQLRRLEQLIKCCENEQILPQFIRKDGPRKKK